MCLFETKCKGGIAMRVQGMSRLLICLFCLFCLFRSFAAFYTLFLEAPNSVLEIRILEWKNAFIPQISPDVLEPNLFRLLNAKTENKKLEIRKGGGGKTYRRDFGGGGKRTIKPPSKTSFGGLRKWDLSGLCPFPLRRMTLRKQRGGGNRIISAGGPKPFLGRGFMVCFPLPWVFPPPPLFLSEKEREKQKIKSGKVSPIRNAKKWPISGKITPGINFWKITDFVAG